MNNTSLAIPLKLRDDFDARHAFTAVGTGSHEKSNFFSKDAWGRQSEPTSANWAIVLVTTVLSGQWSPNLAARSLPICTQQYAPVDALPDLTYALSQSVFLQPVTTDTQSPGERLDLIRKQLGITMTQLADALQLQRATLYRWHEGRQPHAGNEARLSVLEAFAREWDRQNLPPLKKHWDDRIPALNVRVREIICDPLRNAEVLSASLANLRSTVQLQPPLDPYRPRKKARSSLQPSAFDQISPPLWEHEE